ncbi:STIP1-like proteiny and U-box containing protein 1 [Geosmithia morbida]|uniref:STIP1-like proteiny and U-box containing protein 1 n=1 Tax=Geosmithia morbida TaxID=1094350 RepID=A0A9P4Z1E3_9HYPO|nr:STIP1-like proteiny and U-box containing protein 1 [Geosmithia morbida]KAF4126921.1 STIP1-like proteiny and U-box containing protein 1 [Geosmithia morbida]
MGDDKSKALKLKEEGNRHFSKKDYVAAESCYSQALVVDPSLTSLYTNRAMCRFNQGNYEGAVTDCDVCIGLDDRSIKAHYFKSKSLQALGADLDAACHHAQRAYEACRAVDDKSLDMTMAQLLRCRHERWQRREAARRREAQDLEREVLDLLAAQTRRDADEAESDLDRAAIADEGEQKARAMQAIFERARQDADRKRDVPDWLVDDISFNAAINNNAVDPVTREPLAKGELIPNVVLKQACEWFLENNGWAYDW